MANVNSTSGWVSLPSQAVTTATETAVAVPVAGLYGVLPSITLPAGIGLPLILDPDGQTSNATASPVVYTNASIDGHPIKLSLMFEVTVAGAYTFIPKVYQVSAATLLAQTQGTLANDTLIATGSTFTASGAGTYTYWLQLTALYDSKSATLSGYFNSLANATFNATAAITQKTTLNVQDVNFIASVTFGTAGANSFVLKEYLVEKV